MLLQETSDVCNPVVAYGRSVFVYPNRWQNMTCDTVSVLLFLGEITIECCGYL
jgi:hypothetical protein